MVILKSSPWPWTMLFALAIHLFFLVPSAESLSRKNTTTTTTKKEAVNLRETSAAFLTKPAVVQYWGQNSAGATGDGQQAPLATYCDDVTDVLVIAFVNDFNIGGEPGLSLPCGSDCSSVGADIKTCQESGHTILLSLGGAIGAYGFADESQATEFAGTLWDTFGNGQNGGGDRPFGDAVVDGFDLDIEGGTSMGYVQLIAELRSLFSSDDSGKQYYLTAAPQCPFPDARMGTDVTSGLDAVFVQFYNNPCGISGAFNFDTWDAWASGAGVKVLIGIPGAPQAAGSGYVTIETLSSAIAQLSSSSSSSSSSYAGVMVWDASQSYDNTDPSPNFATALGELIHSGSLSSETKNFASSTKNSTRTHTRPISDAGATATKATIVNNSLYTTSVWAPSSSAVATPATSGYDDPYTTSVWTPTTTVVVASRAMTTIVTTTIASPITKIQAYHHHQLALSKKVSTHRCKKNKIKKAAARARPYKTLARAAVPHQEQPDTDHVKKHSGAFTPVDKPKDGMIARK